MGESLAKTNGIRVHAHSMYLKDQSTPRTGKYVWAYRITISNESTNTVQLLSRHWIIENAKGSIEEVKGEGVVGQKPVIQAGQEHQYMSGCVLETSSGSMRGTYQMQKDTGELFEVEISRFVLDFPKELN